MDCAICLSLEASEKMICIYNAPFLTYNIPRYNEDLLSDKQSMLTAFPELLAQMVLYFQHSYRYLLVLVLPALPI